MTPSWPTVEVGSVAGVDPLAAAREALSEHPFCASVPEMPARSPLEGVVARALEGLPWLDDPVEGVLSTAVEDAAFPTAVEAARPSLPSAERAAGLHAFLPLAAAARPARLKAAVVGPVALSKALRDRHGVLLSASASAADALATWVGRLATAYAEALRPLASEAVFVQVDEPGTLDRLTAVEERRLRRVLAAIRAAGALPAVHDCGARSGRGFLALGPHLALVDATHADVPFLADGTWRAFLGAGGSVAWGIVPTDGREPSDPSPTRRVDRLAAVARDAAFGSNVLSPACGLGGLDAASATRARESVRAAARRAAGYRPRV
jgi:hypothetical protein